MTAATRAGGVARMLLRLCSIGFVSVMSACVLPIAPEFQDPPAAANFSPIIVDSDPPLGEIVSATPTSSQKFTVTVSDPNLGDDLHVRFLADFPPNTTNTRDMVPDAQVTHSSNGQPLNKDVSVTPSCTTHNLAKIPEHQIMVIVADSPFDDGPAPAGLPVDLTRLLDPHGLKVIGTWILKLDCP
jgi:hypothetical protein